MIKYIFLITFLNLNFVFAQTNPVDDEKLVKSVVVDYLKWYEKNFEDSLSHFRILDRDNTIEFDTTKIVSINSIKLKSYVDFIRRSGFVSEDYLFRFNKYYEDLRLEFIKQQYKEGTLKPGMEADIMFGFEPELIFNNLDKSKFTQLTIVDRSALLSFRAGQISMVFCLTKIRNKWLIDKFYYDSRPIMEGYR